MRIVASGRGSGRRVRLFVLFCVFLGTKDNQVGDPGVDGESDQKQGARNERQHDVEKARGKGQDAEDRERGGIDAQCLAAFGLAVFD